MQLLEAMADPPEALASMEVYLDDRRGFDPTTWDADQEVAARAQVVEKHAGHVGLVTKGSVIRRVVDAMYAYRPLRSLSRAACPVTVLVAQAATADDEEERERLLALEDAQRRKIIFDLLESAEDRLAIGRDVRVVARNRLFGLRLAQSGVEYRLHNRRPDGPDAAWRGQPLREA